MSSRRTNCEWTGLEVRYNGRVVILHLLGETCPNPTWAPVSVAVNEVASGLLQLDVSYAGHVHTHRFKTHLNGTQRESGHFAAQCLADSCFNVCGL